MKDGHVVLVLLWFQTSGQLKAVTTETNLAWSAKSATYNEMRSLLVSSSVMESRDLVSVSRRVSRPVFWSLGLEGLRPRLGRSLGLEGFRFRSRALRLESLPRLFFMKFCKKFFNPFKPIAATYLTKLCNSRTRQSLERGSTHLWIQLVF